MKNSDYHSVLASEMWKFIVFKQRQGFDYITQAMDLRRFDNYLADRGFMNTALDESVVSEYIVELRKHAPNTRLKYLSVVKEFSRYLAMFDSGSYVIRKNPFRKSPRKQAYIFTRDEVDGLLRAALARPSMPRRQSLSYYMIIGLLAFTGLRIQECLNLVLSDWREKTSEIFVRNGKFKKDRVIPVDSSVGVRMSFFIRRRAELAELHGDTPLFIGIKGTRIQQSCFRKIFSELLDKCGINRSPVTSRPPTIHSLRHTFAVDNIIKWTSQGKDVNAMLPYLSKYMGHVGVTSTQVYLQSVEELRREGAQKFHYLFAKCAASNQKHQS